MCLIPVCIAVLVLTPLPALAHNTCTQGEISFTVFYSGTVTNVLGQPVAGATVNADSSRTHNQTTTGLDGTYTVQSKNECPVNISVTHPIYSSPTPFHSDNPLVDSVSPVNFRLLFKATTSVSPNYLNTTPQMLTFAVDTTAPAATSYVPIRLPSGQTLTTTIDSAAALPTGWTRWMAQWELPTGTEDGAYFYTTCVLKAVQSCSSQPDLLTPTISGSYVLDSVAPNIDYASLTPANHGNTIYTSQRLMAKVTEGSSGSGVSASASFFQLDDLTNTSVPQVTLTSPVYDTASKWLKTSPTALIGGHWYRATLTAKDIVGNTALRTWTFLAQQPTTIDAATADVLGEGEETAQSGTLPATHKWSFRPRITISDMSVHFPESAHPGWGLVGSKIPLGNAKVFVTIAGQRSEWTTTKPYAAAESRTIYRQAFHTKTDATAMNSRIASPFMELPEVLVELPDTVSAAEVVMTAQPITSFLAAVCVDPQVVPSGCTPDPLRYHFTTSFAERAHERLSKDPVQFATGIAVLTPPNPALPAVTGGVWQMLSPVSTVQACQGLPDGERVCYRGGVGFTVESSVYLPTDYASLCAGAVRLCTALDTAPELPPVVAASGGGYHRPEEYEDMANCINMANGKDLNPDPETTGCQQWTTKTIDRPVQAPSRTCDYLNPVPNAPSFVFKFEAFAEAEWGFEDDLNDELGVHWKTFFKTVGAGEVRHISWANYNDLPSCWPAGGISTNYDVDVFPKTAGNMNPTRYCPTHYVKAYHDTGDWSPMDTEGPQATPPPCSGCGPYGVGSGYAHRHDSSPSSDRGWPQWSPYTCDNGGTKSYFGRSFKGWVTEFAAMATFDGRGSTTRADSGMTMMFGHVMYPMKYTIKLRFPTGCAKKAWSPAGMAACAASFFRFEQKQCDCGWEASTDVEKTFYYPSNY